MRSYTACFDFYTDGILKNFKYALPIPVEFMFLMSGEGLVYEPSEPRCDDAPPVLKVKEMLLGRSGDTEMSEKHDCSLNVD